MNNPPLTFIINLMNCATFISGGSLEMMTPINVAAAIPGTLISQLYPKKLSEKYTNGNETMLRIGEFLFIGYQLLYYLIVINVKLKKDTY